MCRLTRNIYRKAMSLAKMMVDLIISHNYAFVFSIVQLHRLASGTGLELRLRVP